MLNYYLGQVQGLLGTQSTALYQTTQLTAYINEARNQVAMRSQCIRVLSPSSGPITALTLNSGGSGYVSTPTVTITPPDFPSGFTPSPQGAQATAVCTISGGAVNTITLQSGGLGYFSPGIAFTNGSATQSATATGTISNITQTVQGQEQYPFSYILSAIQNNPQTQALYSGIGSIVAVRGLAFIWGTFRYARIETSFSKYQALVRTWSQAYQDIPSFASQFGQGISGTLFMYPVPNAAYQFECDVLCLPTPLIDDNTYEAIPQPWVDCVQYYATYKALLGVGRYEDAERMSNDVPGKPGLFQQQMLVARKSAEQMTVSNFYGRSV